jgi:phosphoribosylamine--glycine ligase
MPRLKSDLLTALIAARDGQLHHLDLRWRDEVALTVVMATKGYPGAYEKGTEIRNLDAASAKVEGVQIFHAGTERRDGKLLAMGGRVLNVTALGRDVAEAQARAYKAVDLIDWPEGFCRRDIGWRALKRQRSLSWPDCRAGMRLHPERLLLATRARVARSSRAMTARE